MSDHNDMVQLLRAKLSTAITKYPTGRYGIVGSIPLALTHVRQSGFSEIRASNVWDTEAEVIAALLSVGVSEFQLSDCRWYGR